MKGLIHSEKDTHNKREEQYSYINSNICIARLGRRQPEILPTKFGPTDNNEDDHIKFQENAGCCPHL